MCMTNDTKALFLEKVTDGGMRMVLFPSQLWIRPDLQEYEEQFPIEVDRDNTW